MDVDLTDGTAVMQVDTFKNGEMEVWFDRSVRSKTVVVFASCARNPAGIPVDTAKIEMYHAVDALKRAQAAKVIVFEPFVSCSRSDRTLRRSSVGLWVHFKTLIALGCSHIITYQLHSDKSKSMLDPNRCIIDDIPLSALLEEHLCNTYVGSVAALEKEVRPNWAFCSVDAGGEKLARRYANAFGTALVIAHKQRDYNKPNEVESVNILSAESIEGKTLFIVDDMIDTGGSMETLLRALPARKPAEVNVICTHAVFSGDSNAKFIKLKNEGLINRLIATDSVWCASALIPFLKTVSSTKLAARILRNIFLNQPMADILEEFDAEKYLSRPDLFSLGVNHCE
jgi:ribose-phosphate pyrophosphokinase